MKLKEAQNTILTVLYHCRDLGNIGFIGLSSLFETIGYKYNREMLFETGKYFEAKGFVQALNSIDDVYVQIATLGILYVEELIEQNQVKAEYAKEIAKAIGKKGITKKDIDNPRKVLQRRKSVIGIVEGMRVKLGRGLDPETYDLRLDLEIVKLELKKVEPDQEVIRMKLNRFELNNKYLNEIIKISNSIKLY